MTIQETLRDIGFNEKEIKIYLTLLRRGRMKPSELAHLAKINRTTVYNLAQGLVSKGLIAEDVSSATRFYVPLPPSHLVNLIEQSKREIKEKESLIKRAVSELSMIGANESYPVPKIQFVKEEDLEKFLFDNTTKWQDAIITSDDGIWWGFQDKSFATSYEKWIDSTWKTKQSSHPHYHPQFFSNMSLAEQKLGRKYSKEKREVKILEDTNFTANLWVCGNYLVMISTSQHPFYLIEIHDKMMAHNTAEIFKKMWIH